MLFLLYSIKPGGTVFTLFLSHSLIAALPTKAGRCRFHFVFKSLFNYGFAQLFWGAIVLTFSIRLVSCRVVITSIVIVQTVITANVPELHQVQQRPF